MRPDEMLPLLAIATFLNGLLAGAAIDQTVRHAPARLQLGIRRFDEYSQAVRGGRASAWYGLIDLGATLLNLALGIIQRTGRHAPDQLTPLDLAAVLAVLNLLVGMQAVPLLLAIRRHIDKKSALLVLYARIARWQTIRCVLQLSAYVAVLWSLVIVAGQ
ncbi:MAG: hypothetical protein HUU35_10675 [Armatimonadetes bacterium]|nr:hypothetical protein [Armatimonadota bacterium]